MLAVPMQRILKYHLLLNVMVNATSENHDDFRSYVQAHEAMIDVAQYINEAKRDSELIHNIAVIQNSITALNMPLNTELKGLSNLAIRFLFVSTIIILLCSRLRSATQGWRAQSTKP